MFSLSKQGKQSEVKVLVCICKLLVDIESILILNLWFLPIVYFVWNEWFYMTTCKAEGRMGLGKYCVGLLNEKTEDY